MMKSSLRSCLMLGVFLFAVVMGIAFGALMMPTGVTSAQNMDIVGTWNVVVPGTADAPGFEALQTFHADGTFTETSNLLGAGEEGPAHGVWSADGDVYNLTFQLFAFDPETGESVGRIQVTLPITLDGTDAWTATGGTVHFIAPDGSMELLDDGSSGSIITATRLQVVQPAS